MSDSRSKHELVLAVIRLEDVFLLNMLKPLWVDDRPPAIMDCISQLIQAAMTHRRPYSRLEEEQENTKIDKWACRHLTYLLHAIEDKGVFLFLDEIDGEHFIKSDCKIEWSAALERVKSCQLRAARQIYDLLPLTAEKAQAQSGLMPPLKEFRSTLLKMILGQWCQTANEIEANDLFGYFINIILKTKDPDYIDIGLQTLRDIDKSAGANRVASALKLLCDKSREISPKNNGLNNLAKILLNSLIHRLSNTPASTYGDRHQFLSIAAQLGQIAFMAPHLSPVAMDQLALYVCWLATFDDEAKKLMVHMTSLDETVFGPEIQSQTWQLCKIIQQENGHGLFVLDCPNSNLAQDLLDLRMIRAADFVHLWLAGNDISVISVHLVGTTTSGIPITYSADKHGSKFVRPQ